LAALPKTVASSPMVDWTFLASRATPRVIGETRIKLRPSKLLKELRLSDFDRSKPSSIPPPMVARRSKFEVESKVIPALARSARSRWSSASAFWVVF